MGSDHTAAPAIRRAVRRDDTTLRLGGVGDCWFATWGGDDRLYLTMNDGCGWAENPPEWYNHTLFALAGDLPDVRVEQPPYPSVTIGGIEDCQFYGIGLLSVGGDLYSFASALDAAMIDGKEAVGFAGVKLLHSPDGGATWHNQDGSTPVVWDAIEDYSRERLVFHEEPDRAFSWVALLQMGRDYELNRDGYVYGYGPNGLVDGLINELVMFRVRKDAVLDRSRYEFFAGTDADGVASWSAGIADRGVVLTFPSGWANRISFPWSWIPSIVYDEALDVYLMATWGTAPTPDGTWFGAPSYLGMWSAPTPWGPWTQFHEEPAWLPLDNPKAWTYLPQIVPKWMGEDGLSFWMIWGDFSADEAMARELEATGLSDWSFSTPEGRRSNRDLAVRYKPGYSLVMQRVDLELEPPAP